LFVNRRFTRGPYPGSEGLLAWVLPGHRVHVLLSKGRQAHHGEAASVLRAATATLGDPRDGAIVFAR